jgi:hypothetical protein
MAVACSFVDLLPSFLGVENLSRRHAEESYQQMRESAPHEVSFEL